MLSVKGSIFNFFNLILICAAAKHNWFEAQADCMKKGAMLKRNFESTQYGTYHWTGFYVRKSRWIKIIGCFRNATVVDEIKKTYIMPISSAGLCQEICFEHNHYSFGIQDNKCVCLEDTPHADQMTPDACNIKCNSNNINSYPMNLKFSEDCGGQGVFNVFLSATAAEENVIKASIYLTIQCTDKKFIGVCEDCKQTDFARICNHTEIKTGYSNWKIASTLCKQSSRSYLMGDVNLTDVNSACSRINGIVTGPAWLGVAKEMYISVDRGTYLSKYDLSTFMEKCQKCDDVGCTFTSCSEKNTVDCMMRPTIPTAVATTAFKQETRSEIDGTMHTFKDSDMVSTSTLQSVLQAISTTAGKKNLQNKNQSIFKSVDDREGKDTYLAIEVVLPIVAVTGIGSVAIAVLLIRRKRSKENRRSTIHQNEHDFIQRPGVHTLSNENCYVLEAAYSRTTEKTNEDIEDLYNKSTDGEYDHLRDGYSKQRLNENTYDHVSCLERQESSDYDVTNVHVKCPQTDTTYDRTTAFKGSSASGYNICTTDCPEDYLYAKPVKSHAF